MENLKKTEVVPASETYTKHSIETALAQLRDQGHALEPVYGDEHILLLDLDTFANQMVYTKNLRYAQRWMELIETDRWLSKSGNLHVVLRTDACLGLRERAALQAFLGSDPTRELVSWFQAKESVLGVPQEDPHVLFRPVNSIWPGEPELT